MDTGRAEDYLLESVLSVRTRSGVLGVAIGVWGVLGRADSALESEPRAERGIWQGEADRTTDGEAIELLDYRALVEDSEGRITPEFDARHLPSFRVSGVRVPSWEVSLVIGAERIRARVEASEPPSSFVILRARTSTWAIGKGPGFVEIRLAETGQELRRWPALWTEAPEDLGGLARFRMLLTSKRLAEARAELDERGPTLDPSARIWALGQLASRSDDPISAWSDFAEAALREKIPSEATRGWRNAAYGCWETRRLADVELLLAKADALDERIGHPRGRATTRYYRGMAATDLGYYRRAIGDFTEGMALAWSLGLDGLAALQLNYLAIALEEQGLHQEALAELERVSAYFEGLSRDSAKSDSEAFMRYRNTLAWVLLRGMAQGAFAKDFPRVRKMEDEARAIAVRLHKQKEEANIVANMAWAAHLDGDRAAAHALLEEAERLDPSKHAYASVFMALTEARLLLDEGRAGESEDRFERGERLAREESGGQDSDFTWRAAYGRGQALAAQGRQDRALAYFRAALLGLERLSTRTGVRSTRALFFEERRQLVDDMVELLLARSATEEAFQTEDQARAIVLRGLESRVRAERLSEEQRLEWERRVGRYLDARGAYEKRRGRAELLSGKALDAFEIEQARARRAVADAFDAAYAYLDDSASSFVASGASARAIGRALEEDEALITFASIHRETSVFILRRGSIRHAWIKDGDLSPVLDRIGRARHLYVVPGGVDAALALATGVRPSSNGAVIESIGISFLPYAGALLRRGERSKGPPLVVADPNSNLPFARREGEAVAHLFPEGRFLSGETAKRSEVLASMNNARVFHFAGHGEVRSEQPWDAHLKLAGDETLSLEELLIARPRAGVVVLSGCDTGKQGKLSASERVGLPEAFLLAGAHAILATDRKVNDEDASRFIRRFYDAGGADHPGPAFQRAAVASLRENDRVWEAFRLVGGR